MFCWYAREKWGSQFSLVACEDCLEVCFVGLVVEKICVWYFVMVAIFIRFGQADAKRCGGCLKVTIGGWRCKSQKGALHREDRFSLCNCYIVKCNMLYCKSYWVYTVKDFIGCLFSPYYCCFMCLRLANKAKSATQSVLMALKLNGLFQKNFQVFQVFYSPENYISLTLSPFPFCLFFPLQCLYYNF